jgi:hypothetical protein
MLNLKLRYKLTTVISTHSRYGFGKKTVLLVVSIFVAGATAKAEWTVDFSRRLKDQRAREMSEGSRAPASFDTSYVEEIRPEALPEENSTTTVLPAARTIQSIPLFKGSSVAPQPKSMGPLAEKRADMSGPKDSYSNGTSQENRVRSSETLIGSLFSANEVAQEVVILNTESGFVPSSVRIRRGLKYRIHVVNVNEKEKNVSFVLDGFAEHHSTFFGKMRSFELQPSKEGVFSYQSPETGSEGKLIVLGAEGLRREIGAVGSRASDSPQNGDRQPASEK